VTKTESPVADPKRVSAWHHAAQAAICDVIEPWQHGTVVRATRYPSYFDYNVVRVEEDPAMDVEALTRFADEALAGLAHRRIDFEHMSAAEPMRGAFERRGWRAMRLSWMRLEREPPPVEGESVEEVPYDAVEELRRGWQSEDFPDRDGGGYHVQSREVALRRGARVLAMRDGSSLVAFAQLERDGAAAEITQVYVRREHRGAGRGSAIVRAAIAAAGDVRDLWICADDEDRPKRLYARLGFRPVWTTMEFLRTP
jgi:GNAT superfamily N-acetyltransferase